MKNAFEAGLDFCKNVPKNERQVFGDYERKGAQNKDQYFLDSANKIGYFFEKDALDKDGNLLVDECISLNKVISYYYRSIHKREVFKIPTKQIQKIIIKILFICFQVGHVLHLVDPTFKSITFSDKIKDICHKLNLKKPVIVQSMCIYKNPGIGGKGKNT